MRDFTEIKKTFEGSKEALKVINHIESITDKNFLNDYKNYSAMDLVQTILKSGLATKGLEYSELTKADQTGKIWVEKR